MVGDSSHIQRDTSNTTTKSAIEALGRTCTIFPCDLTSRPSITSLVPFITRTHRIDILINNAGIVERNPATAYTISQYDSLMQVNVTASWLLCQGVGRYWLENGMRGKIVNMSSIQGFVGGVDQAPYAMSKGAVELMTRSLSNEWAGKGINVNNIAPG